MSIDIEPSNHRVWTMRLALLVAAVLLLRGVSQTPELAFAYLLFVPIVVRDTMVRVWVDNDRLRVRNFWRNDNLARSEIESFSVVDLPEGHGGRTRTVYVRLKDQGGQHRLTATRRIYHRGRPAPGDVETVDTFCVQLNTWLRTGA